jgi:hypothetical protein
MMITGFNGCARPRKNCLCLVLMDMQGASVFPGG